MTVCFAFDPKKEPWITPYDRRDTRNNPEPDGKISTYDFEAIPHALSRYNGTSVTYDYYHGNPEKLCDALYVEIVKGGFFDQIIKPQAQQGASLWKNGNSASDWRIKIISEFNGAMDRISQRQIRNNLVKGPSLKMRDDQDVGTFMGDHWKNPFASAKHFVDCASDGALKMLEEEKPILAGVGITLKKEPGQLPRIYSTLPQTYYTLQKLSVNVPDGIGRGGAIIASIDGKPTESMTEEEMAAALSGPEGTDVKLEIAEYEGSEEENLCSMEPKVIKVLDLPRKLSLGPIMIQCGGIDL